MLLLLAAAGAGLYYYFANYSTTVTTVTAASPITIPGVGPVAVAPLVYGPTDTQLGLDS